MGQTKAICKSSILFPPKHIFLFSAGPKPCSKGNRDTSTNAQMDVCIQMDMILLEFHRKWKGWGASKPGLATHLPLTSTPTTHWASELSAKLNLFILRAGRRFACPWLLLRALGSSWSPRARAGLWSGHGSWLVAGRGPAVSGKTLVIRLTRKIFSNRQVLSWSFESLYGFFFFHFFGLLSFGFDTTLWKYLILWNTPENFRL